jgi:alkanesulfonate monooxygenase SsuD/methylene tetrahydromethanopterin reductase-like flavin-dependent oxidoreductase (luciferase family)
MQALWCDELSSFRGEFYELPECVFEPKPVQRPHPPILFGGESDPALRRVAELGQGWFGFNLTPEALPERLERLEAALAENGRARDDIVVYVSPAQWRMDADTVERFADLGVDQLILPLAGRDVAGLERRADALAKLIP